ETSTAVLATGSPQRVSEPGSGSPGLIWGYPAPPSSMARISATRQAAAAAAAASTTASPAPEPSVLSRWLPGEATPTLRRVERPHVLRRPPITAAAIPAPTSIPSAPHNHGATASAASPRNQAMTFSADTTLDKPKRSTTNRRTHLLRHYPCRRGRVPKSPCRAETPFRCVENPTLSPVRGDNGGQRRDGPAPASRAGGGAATGRSAENRRPP